MSQRGVWAVEGSMEVPGTGSDWKLGIVQTAPRQAEASALKTGLDGVLVSWRPAITDKALILSQPTTQGSKCKYHFEDNMR